MFFLTVNAGLQLTASWYSGAYVRGVRAMEPKEIERLLDHLARSNKDNGGEKQRI
jgi:hypothetical protein